MRNSLEQLLENLNASKSSEKPIEDGLILTGEVTTTTAYRELRQKPAEGETVGQIWAIQASTVVKGGNRIYHLERNYRAGEEQSLRIYKAGERVRILVTGIRIGSRNVGVDGSGRRIYQEENTVSNWVDLDVPAPVSKKN